MHGDKIKKAFRKLENYDLTALIALSLGNIPEKFKTSSYPQNGDILMDFGVSNFLF